MSNTETNSPARLTFAAIDPWLEERIVSPKEVVLTGRNRVNWGASNGYPDYLLDLFNSVPTLRAIVTGSADFVAGDDVVAAGPVNTRGDNARDIVRDCGLDYFLYGGFALQVIRNHEGGVAEVYYCDIRHLRSDKENEVFYYSEKWNKGARDAVVYPKYIDIAPDRWAAMDQEEKDRHASSILYVKDDHTKVYPAPCWCAAVKPCELERGIADYHFNNIENGFMPNVLINFNGGQPTDEIREEIEAAVSEKFLGHANAGRPMFSWNDSKDTMTIITPIKVEDFTAKYESLAKYSRQQIFTAFGASPVIFGIPTDNNGFSTDDYEAAFKLYNRTRVKPVQRLITDAFARVFGTGFITIQPFTLDGADATQIA